MPRPRKPPKPRKPYIRWSEAVAVRVCIGLSQGISLRRLGARPDMPSPQQVRAWMRARPDFAARVRRARALGGVDRPGRHSGYDPDIAAVVFDRLVWGEPLYRIAADPALPSLMTLYNWMHRHPRFARQVWLARDLHFERLGGLAREAMVGLSEDEARHGAGPQIRRMLGGAVNFAARRPW